jgi:hypothetical protein
LGYLLLAVANEQDGRIEQARIAYAEAQLLYSRDKGYASNGRRTTPSSQPLRICIDLSHTRLCRGPVTIFVTPNWLAEECRVTQLPDLTLNR